MDAGSNALSAVVEAARAAAWSLIPPIGFMWLIAAGLVLRQRWTRLGNAMVGLAAFGLLVFSVPAVSYSLLALGMVDAPNPMEQDLRSAAIVVLSGDVRRGATEYGGTTVGPLSLERLRYAAQLQKKTGLPVLASGGPIAYGDLPLARLMAKVLVEEFGLPEVWIEDRSRNTAENANFSAAFLEPRAICTVVLVTHAWHMRRAAAAFRREGLRVVPAPTLPPWQPRSYRRFLPSLQALDRSFFGVHELLGGAFYAVDGGHWVGLDARRPEGNDAVAPPAGATRRASERSGGSCAH